MAAWLRMMCGTAHAARRLLGTVVALRLVVVVAAVAVAVTAKVVRVALAVAVVAVWRRQKGMCAVGHVAPNDLCHACPAPSPAQCVPLRLAARTVFPVPCAGAVGNSCIFLPVECALARSADIL